MLVFVLSVACLSLFMIHAALSFVWYVGIAQGNFTGNTGGGAG